MTDGLTGAPTTVCGATLSGDVTTEMSSPGWRGARSSSGTSGITNGVAALLAASDETTGTDARVSVATGCVATAGTVLETTFAAAGAAGAVDGAAALTAGALATTGAVGATAPADGATGAAASAVVLAARAGAFLPLAVDAASA